MIHRAQKGTGSCRVALSVLPGYGTLAEIGDFQNGLVPLPIGYGIKFGLTLSQDGFLFNCVTQIYLKSTCPYFFAIFLRCLAFGGIHLHGLIYFCIRNSDNNWSNFRNNRDENWRNGDKNMRKSKTFATKIFWIVEVWSVQNYITIVDLVKSFRTSTYYLL